MPSLRKKVSGMFRQISFTGSDVESDELTTVCETVSARTVSLRHKDDVNYDYTHSNVERCSLTVVGEGTTRNGYRHNRANTYPYPHDYPGPGTSRTMSGREDDGRAMNESFIHMYMTGRLKKRTHPEVYYGKTGVDLPVLQIVPFIGTVYACQSGPDGGLTKVSCVSKRPLVKIANLDDELKLSLDCGINLLSRRTNTISETSPASILGSPCGLETGKEGHYGEDQPDVSFSDWNSPHPRACGLSTSLYERHPYSALRAGDPVADVFAICARPNSCILALADGVNWGERSRLAARCAVRGSIEHLTDELYDQENAVSNSADVFRCLLRAFHAGHQLILQEGGSLTTLCVVVVCQLKDSAQWLVCSCNVGDSLAFVFSEKYGVREITLGSHDIRRMRDMRDAGGALGPVDGVNPELHNFTCAMTIVDRNDWVFLTSDGVSDNFDPVVGKFCVIKENTTPKRTHRSSQQTFPKDHQENGTENVPESGLTCMKSPIPSRKDMKTSGRKTNSLRAEFGPFSSQVPSHLPTVEAYQRHELMLLRMEYVIRRHFKNPYPSPSPSSLGVCEALLDFAIQLTTKKRRLLEDPEIYRFDDSVHAQKAQKQRRRLIRQRTIAMPGKLDHATVVAYRVGEEVMNRCSGTNHGMEMLLEAIETVNDTHGNEIAPSLRHSGHNDGPSHISTIDSEATSTAVLLEEQKPTPDHGPRPNGQGDQQNEESNGHVSTASVDHSSLQFTTSGGIPELNKQIEKRNEGSHTASISPLHSLEGTSSETNQLNPNPSRQLDNPAPDSSRTEMSSPGPRTAQDPIRGSGRFGKLSKALDRVIQWKHRSHSSSGQTLDQPEWSGGNDKPDGSTENTQTVNSPSPGSKRGNTGSYSIRSSQSTPRRMSTTPWSPIRAFQSFRGTFLARRGASYVRMNRTQQNAHPTCEKEAVSINEKSVIFNDHIRSLTNSSSDANIVQYGH